MAIKILFHTINERRITKVLCDVKTTDSVRKEALLKDEKDKNILFTVNLLSIKDLQSVRSMDASSGFQVEQWLEDNSEYAWESLKMELMN